MCHLYVSHLLMVVVILLPADVRCPGPHVGPLQQARCCPAFTIPRCDFETVITQDVTGLNASTDRSAIGDLPCSCGIACVLRGAVSARLLLLLRRQLWWLLLRTVVPLLLVLLMLADIH